MGGAVEKLRPLVKKNGPVILVLLLGLILMLWPQKKEAAPAAEPQQEQTEDLEEKLEAMEEKILANATNSAKLSELMQEKEALEQQLEEKMDRWVYLNDLNEQIQKQ